jgi:hypothetical protein
MPLRSRSTSSLPSAFRSPPLRFPPIQFLRRAVLSLALIVGAAPALAQGTAATSTVSPSATKSIFDKSAWEAPEPWRTDRFYIQTSVVTVHFNPDEDHDNTTQLVDISWRLSQRWLEGQVFVGASFFDNSFGQPSQYYYGGLLWRPFETAQPLYFKLTAGLLYGYKDEFQNKVPFNNNGFSPGIVPSVGYCYNRFCSELVLFGTAGALLTLGVSAP